MIRTSTSPAFILAMSASISLIEAAAGDGWFLGIVTAASVAKVLVSDFVSRRGRPDRRGRAGRMFEAVVGDGTGSVKLKWFHASDAIARLVKKDARLLITGDVKRYRFNKEIAHPEIELLPDEEADCESTPESVRSIVPDYATPEGIHPRGLRRAIQAAVESYADLVPGHLPKALVHKRGLPKPAESLRSLHTPPLPCGWPCPAAGSSRGDSLRRSAGRSAGPP